MVAMTYIITIIGLIKTNNIKPYLIYSKRKGLERVAA